MDQINLAEYVSDNNKTNSEDPDSFPSPLVSFASWYAEHNFPIIPLCPYNHEGMSEHHISVCSKPGKM